MPEPVPRSEPDPWTKKATYGERLQAHYYQDLSNSYQSYPIPSLNSQATTHAHAHTHSLILFLSKVPTLQYNHYYYHYYYCHHQYIPSLSHSISPSFPPPPFHTHTYAHTHTRTFVVHLPCLLPVWSLLPPHPSFTGLLRLPATARYINSALSQPFCPREHFISHHPYPPVRSPGRRASHPYVSRSRPRLRHHFSAQPTATVIFD